MVAPIRPHPMRQALYVRGIIFSYKHNAPMGLKVNFSISGGYPSAREFHFKRRV